MAKVFIGVGHGGSDSGAVGYITEKDANLNMAIACKDYLEANGVEVKMSRYKDEDDTLNEEVRECNAFNPNLAIDVHNNAGGGDGFEIYHTLNGGVGKALAENIEAEVKAIGQNSRGIKTKRGNNGDYYGFIRMTKCPAVICEGVFVDNREDAWQADELHEQEQFGIAYAKGILKTLGIVGNVGIGTAINTEVKHDVSIGEAISINNSIYNIQKFLNDEYGTNLALDNIYGAQTKKALIKALQTELNRQFNKGLVVDGIFGNNTYNACITVRKGAKGNITKLIQMALVIKGYKVDVDSIFGSDTEAKVKAFQKANGLVVDGIVGKNTFKALFA